MEEAPRGPPLLRAVASSTRPLYQLLKAVGFTNKVHVEITENGLRFAADHARVMQGVTHWGKDLFTKYTTNLPESEEEDGDAAQVPSFQISLPALLETLQIFGATDAAARQSKADLDPYGSKLRNYRPEVFSHQVLGIAGTCSLSYAEEGEPFSIILEESGVKTTCNLTTYVSDTPEEIPFDIEDLSFKIIMQARVFLDALGEIAPSQPEKLTITASKKEPFLKLSTSGALGSTSVDFAKGRDLLETFSVQETWRQTFKFDILKSATEAMRIASKVSLRGDRQGVLSMQFMVEVEGAGLSFLDFRFVPYADHVEGDEDEEEQETGEDVAEDGVF